MPIFYGVIARGDTVLCEHSVATGNFISVSSIILSRIQPNETRRMSYAYDTHTFHFIVLEGITFMCMCDSQFQRRLAFGFLDDLKMRFEQHASLAEAKTAPAFAYKNFSGILSQQMDFFSNDPSADKIQLAKHQIEESKKQMSGNIENLLERDEKIDLMVQQSEQLQEQTFEFKEQSKKLKCAMLLRSIKCWILLFIIFVFVAWLISSLICGFDYSECTSDDNDDNNDDNNDEDGRRVIIEHLSKKVTSFFH
eukprot:CAMPEP_0201522660 /NCGR_PEP_ID=MMETSP0161_2-20130828/18473_1 /ASSEMBLY_ACC=CAM_ASM_000251 /TAXON_ID=180227 /ORGANISM="Neoparamoeba aestuarina, Strain SoJaBio B1-5/56/2" /LENGTH=251 /DNA_ID=CAMNT_0047921571 /DNA_START=112 /DNA_END=867 /DNA_ORIENTATION=+